jgi:hypothetical protein
VEKRYKVSAPGLLPSIRSNRTSMRADGPEEKLCEAIWAGRYRHDLPPVARAVFVFWLFVAASFLGFCIYSIFRVGGGYWFLGCLTVAALVLTTFVVVMKRSIR